MPRIKVRFVIRIRTNERANETDSLDLEIQYREALIQQFQRNQDEYQRLEEHHRRLIVECQYYGEEYSSEKLQNEYDYHQKLHSDYEKVQQEFKSCLSKLEQHQQTYQQIQSNIEQIEKEMELLQTTMKNEKKVS